MEDYVYVDDDEEKKKKKKKRLILWLILLIIFIIGAIISVVLVIAANQQVLNTDININYKAHNVSAEVSAKYWIADKKINMYSGNNLSIIFDPSESEVDRNISPRENIVLEGEHGIVFEYKFRNLNNASKFSINLIRTPFDYGEKNTYNINQKFYISSTELTINQFNALSDEQFSSSFSPQIVDVGEGTTLYVYIRVNIVKLENNAAYYGTFDWNLTNIDALA